MDTAAPEQRKFALGLSAHPPALRGLFFTELWERFSFYGMRALLTLFMVAAIADGGLGFTTAEAGRIYGSYSMAVYMLAIPGGFIADRILGAKNSVLVGGCVIALGHYALAIPALPTFYIGLVLIALGTGLFKPNISALVGALYERDDDRRDAGFSIFYMGINIGAFLAPLATGFLAQSAQFKSWLAGAGFDPAKSWHWGFAAAGVGMTLAMILFAANQDQFHERATGAAQARPSKGDIARHGAYVVVATLALLGLALLSDRDGFTWLRWTFLALPLAAVAYGATRPDADARRLAAIAILFIASMIFWAIFEQSGTTLSLFADRLTTTEVAGLPFPSSWFQSVNPIFVIVLTPLVAALWLKLGARQPSAPVKFALGLLFVAASFALMIPAASLASEGRVSPLWLLALYLLQTMGELMLSPVGLSTMTRLAPAGMTGLVLGLWFLAAALGNKLAGVIGGTFDSSDPAAIGSFFTAQALWVALAGLLLLVLAPWANRLARDA